MAMVNTPSSQKVDNSIKTTVSQSTNSTKTETTQIIANGPLVSSSTSSHVSVPSNGHIQRVQTIHLPPQKQQMFKNIQSQIQTILNRKSGTSSDQAMLAKLYNDQAKLLSTAKILTTTHSVSNVSIHIKEQMTITSNRTYRM